MAVTEDTETVAPLPEADRPFHIERHGIDFIPLTERWAKPRDLGGMWAGASVQVEYFIYGALLIGFGFTFAQTLSIIIIGNLSFFLLGLCSLQGPQTGTTAMAINRAAYGPNGSRPISFFNWLTQIGFEVEGLILIVGAALLLTDKSGFLPGTPAKIVFVLVAVGIQILLPFLGHATIVKTLRLLVVPFLIIFAILLGYSVHHAHLVMSFHGGANWQTYMAGLAFTIALSGLGWTECGNDYSRYLKPDASKKGIVGWVFVGTAVPEIAIMTLGAAVGTFITGIGNTEGSGAFGSFLHQSAIPSWFIIVFLVFAMIQLFAINSLDLYSSGVTLQAMGVKIKRYQAVLVDSAICLGVTMWAVFVTSFGHFLRDFVDVVIIWIAPWCGIFLMDWAMRKWRYVASALQRTDHESFYYREDGVFWPAIIAQVVGMGLAMAALYPTFSVPTWANPITVHTGGADFSVFTGFFGGALIYLALGWIGVRRKVQREGELLSAEASAP